MSTTDVQYIANERGDITAAVVPIELWREIASELETQHLLRSPAMRERLLESLGREGGYTLDEVLERLNISADELSGENK